MDVAAISDSVMLNRIAGHDEVMASGKRCAWEARTAIGKTATIPMNATTPERANVLCRAFENETAGRHVALGVRNRSPAAHLAIRAANNVTASRGTAMAVARPKSYRAANAV